LWVESQGPTSIPHEDNVPAIKSRFKVGAGLAVGFKRVLAQLWPSEPPRTARTRGYVSQLTTPR
jgi:hypothetical protein